MFVQIIQRCLLVTHEPIATSTSCVLHIQLVCEGDNMVGRGLQCWLGTELNPKRPWRSTCRVWWRERKATAMALSLYSLANYSVICSFTGICNVLFICECNVLLFGPAITACCLFCNSIATFLTFQSDKTCLYYLFIHLWARTWLSPAVWDILACSIISTTGH
jgi:hypothetical protein